MPHTQPGNNTENNKLHFKAEVMAPIRRSRRTINDWVNE